MKNRYSIAFIKSQLGKKEGGLEKQTRKLIHAFKERYCDLSLVTASSVNLSDVATFQLPISTWCSAAKVFSFNTQCNRFFDHHRFDIVLGLDRTSFQTHLRAGNGVHAAYLSLRKEHDSFLDRLSLQVNPLHKALLHIEKQGFENPALQAIITNSHMVKEQILHYYNVPESKIHPIHNGVEWRGMQQAFEEGFVHKPTSLGHIPIPRDRYHFLFIGHDFNRKGLSLILKGLSLINKKEYCLHVVGKDRKQKAFLKLANDLGIRDSVFFYGDVANPIPFYQVADCLLIPSFYDPFANVTIEALAMGLQVITSKNNGAKEILAPKSGFVLETYRKEEMAEKLQLVMKAKKTAPSATLIRESVQGLDFSLQLEKVVTLCLQ